jgi:acetyl esterase/lipase
MLSLRARFARWIIRTFLRPFLFSGPLEKLRRRQRPQRLSRRVRTERVVAAGVPAIWFVPEGASDRVLLYLHGGGFVMCSPWTHGPMAAAIARKAGARALLPDYRLAPEHPFPAALDDCVAVYRWLLAKGVKSEAIVIGGDSAGGNLTLATLLSIRDADLPMPAGAICLSPATDLTASGESFRTHAKDEVLLTVPFCQEVGPLYVGQHDPAAPLLSPLFADLSGLPPMLIHVGTRELLLDDSVRLAERAKGAGVEVSLKIWEGLWHAFQLFNFFPEARQAVAELGAFVRERLEASETNAGKARPPPDLK